MAAWIKLRRAPPASREDQMRALAAQLTALEAHEQQVADTVWANELLAEQCGQVFERWWDALNAAPDKSAVLAGLPMGELTVPEWAAPEQPGHGIEVRKPSGRGSTCSSNQWQQVLAEARQAGWQLAQTEFRHNQFEVDARGSRDKASFSSPPIWTTHDRTNAPA